MKKLFTDLAIGFVLIILGVIAGYALNQKYILERYGEVLNGHRTEYTIEDLHYIAIGEELK